MRVVWSSRSIYNEGVSGGDAMMKYPLTLTTILERARTFFPKKQIVTQLPDGVHRCTYADLYTRVCRLANVLTDLGVRTGDRVGTFGWSTLRHLEAYFAAPCIGAVVHTVNIRLGSDDLAYIINHAGDRVLLVDEDLLPIIEAVAPRLETVEHFVVMEDRLPVACSLPALSCYEELMAQASDSFAFPDLDEDAPAGLCYTSATTGQPKGVTYTHCGIYLHTMTECITDAFALSERDVILPIVPMFHVNTWGVPYAAAFLGATLLLPGIRPDAKVICNLIQQEKATIALGVPTIWIGVLDFLNRTQERYDLSSLRMILIGGAAVPPNLIEAYDKIGVKVVHGYGMTEATPLVAISRVKSYLESLDDAGMLELRAKQGLLLPGLAMKVVDEEGRELAWDGRQQGELLLRGPWIASEYYNDPRTAETFREGWYHTGDIVSVDPEGYIQIVDRAKDVIKSGGEWISSVDLEAAIMAHPGVLEAAVIAIPHERWQERPLACVAARHDFRGSLTKTDILDFLKGKVARFWLPDDVVFLDEIPKTSVGKFDKKVLRERFQG